MIDSAKQYKRKEAMQWNKTNRCPAESDVAFEPKFVRLQDKCAFTTSILRGFLYWKMLSQRQFWEVSSIGKCKCCHWLCVYLCPGRGDTMTTLLLQVPPIDQRLCTVKTTCALLCAMFDSQYLGIASKLISRVRFTHTHTHKRIEPFQKGRGFAWLCLTRVTDLQ